MNNQEDLVIHKARVRLLLDLLPYSVPRYKKVFYLFKIENDLNNFVSSFITKNYILDLDEKENQFLDKDLYKNICLAYEYILNVVDGAVVYDEEKMEEIRKKLDL